jgi:hypothetical protein
LAALKPVVNVTVPVGDVLPLDALTVIVSVVDAFCEMLAGLAIKFALVWIRGAVTVTAIAGESDAS